MNSSTHSGAVATLAALAALALVPATSGCLRSSDAPPDTTSTTPSSLQATFAVTATASPGGGACGRKAASDGWSVRVDRFDDRLVLSPPFDDAGTFLPKDGGYALAPGAVFQADGATEFDIYEEMWRTFSFDFAGRSGAGTGQMQFGADIAQTCDLEATIALAGDTTPPTMKLLDSKALGPVLLPWDPRTILASEPYEGSVDGAKIFGAAAGEPTIEPITAAAFSPPKERGVRVAAGDWDLAPTLTMTTPIVRDPSGNASQAQNFPFGGAAVAARGGTALSWPLVGAAPYTWGTPAIGVEDCEPGATCFRLHTQRLACDWGSFGGLATRLSPGGTLHVRMRAISTCAYVAIAVPGQFPKAIDGAPCSPRDSGTDSGWVDVRAPIPAGAREVGIAIAAGGMGPAVSPYGSGFCFGGSSKTTETVLVETIETVP